MIVFPDTEVDEIVEGAVHGMNLEVCQGQSCGSNARVFVHRRLYDDVVDGLAERLGNIRVGPAYEPGTDMGPLVSAAHLERVTGYVEAGRQEGARIATGGGAPSDMNGGYYLEPTLFADVDMSMRIAREEIFGPVISVLPWDDWQDVLAQANSVEYGLTASVWTADLDLAHATAHSLEAGYVWINDSSTHYWGTPFGGFKNSGTGREESVEELKSYMEQQVIHTMLRDPVEAYAQRYSSDST